MMTMRAQVLFNSSRLAQIITSVSIYTEALNPRCDLSEAKDVWYFLYACQSKKRTRPAHHIMVIRGVARNVNEKNVITVSLIWQWLFNTSFFDIFEIDNEGSMFIVILCLIVLVSEYAYHRTQFVSLVKCIVQIMFFLSPSGASSMELHMLMSFNRNNDTWIVKMCSVCVMYFLFKPVAIDWKLKYF